MAAMLSQGEPLQTASEASKASRLASLVTHKCFLLGPMCIAIIGFAIHASLLFKPNSTGAVYPQSRGFMLALSLVFFCGEGVILNFSPNTVLPSNNIRRNAAIALAGLFCAVSFFLFLMNAIGQRVDGTLWSIALFLVTTLVATIFKRRLGEASDLPTRSRCMSVCIYANYFALFIAAIFYILLLVGTSIQTDGWIRYQPNGTFVTLQLATYEQRILTQCSNPTANVPNPPYLTVWLETGGGGHGMADLWPLRDALNFQGFRVCSYDMPGIGHSSYAVKGQNSYGDNGSLMKMVMDAMKESGPFIVMASMDEAQDRAWQFAIKYPSMVSAIVVAGQASRFNEATSYAKFKGISNPDAAIWYRQQLQGRLTFGTILSVVIDLGLMSSFAPPNPNYGISLDKAREKVFLAIWNDKTWTTNVFVGIEQTLAKSDVELTQERVFAKPISASIPVVLVQRDATASTNKLCSQFGESNDICVMQRFNDKLQIAENDFIYKNTITTLPNPLSTVITMNCTDCMSDFDVNQNRDVPTFVSLVLRALGFQVKQ